MVKRGQSLLGFPAEATNIPGKNYVVISLDPGHYSTLGIIEKDEKESGYYIRTVFERTHPFIRMLMELKISFGRTPPKNQLPAISTTVPKSIASRIQPLPDLFLGQPTPTPISLSLSSLLSSTANAVTTSIPTQPASNLRSQINQPLLPMQLTSALAPLPMQLTSAPVPTAVSTARRRIIIPPRTTRFPAVARDSDFEETLRRSALESQRQIQASSAEDAASSLEDRALEEALRVSRLES
jgi:hypothetical protein